MSRIRHDQFAKELLTGLLQTVGEAKTELNVTSEVRKIDLLFVPLPEKADDRQKLGLPGRIATTTCLITESLLFQALFSDSQIAEPCCPFLVFAIEPRPAGPKFPGDA